VSAGHVVGRQVDTTNSPAALSRFAGSSSRVSRTRRVFLSWGVGVTTGSIGGPA
jgi:hypothetical protein